MWRQVVPLTYTTEAAFRRVLEEARNHHLHVKRFDPPPRPVVGPNGFSHCLCRIVGVRVHSLTRLHGCSVNAVIHWNGVGS